MKVVYIAGPYRGDNAYVVHRNVNRAERMAMRVAKAGGMPLCPHCNTRNFDGTLTDVFWLEGTLELLRRCDALVLINGWRRSSGARKEHEEALALGMPIFEEASFSDLEKWLGNLAAAPPAKTRAALGENCFGTFSRFTEECTSWCEDAHACAEEWSARCAQGDSYGPLVCPENPLDEYDCAQCLGLEEGCEGPVSARPTCRLQLRNTPAQAAPTPPAEGVKACSRDTAVPCACGTGLGCSHCDEEDNDTGQMTIYYD